MNTFSDTFERPVVVKIGERDVSIPQLTTRDYLPWLDELTAAQRTRDKGLIAPGTKPIERFQILKNIEANEVTPDDLVPLLFTARGTIKVLDMALKKAGLGESEATAFIDSQSAKANEKLATRVSGLLSAMRYASIYEIPPDPDTAAKPESAETFGGTPGPNPPTALQSAA